MIIGLIGAKGCGKSTVFAKHLIEEYGYTSIGHADPIKRMLIGLGLTKDHTDGYLKETPCKELCGKTPRWAMQSLGTEWGRRLIGEDLWLEAWDRAVEEHDNVVTDGVRFPNEIDRIDDKGGITIKIRMPEVEGSSDHESELYCMTVKTDFEIFNKLGSPEVGIKELDDIMFNLPN